MSLPKPDVDTTPMAMVSLTDEQAALLVSAAEDILTTMTLDGPNALPPLAIALAHMVKDYLG